MKIAITNAYEGMNPGAVTEVEPSPVAYKMVMGGYGAITDITPDERKAMRTIAVGARFSIPSMVGKLSDKVDVLINEMLVFMQGVSQQTGVPVPPIIEELAVANAPLISKELSPEQVAAESKALGDLIGQALEQIEGKFPN